MRFGNMMWRCNFKNREKRVKNKDDSGLLLGCGVAIRCGGVIEEKRMKRKEQGIKSKDACALGRKVKLWGLMRVFVPLVHQPVRFIPARSGTGGWRVPKDSKSLLDRLVVLRCPFERSQELCVLSN